MCKGAKVSQQKGEQLVPVESGPMLHLRAESPGFAGKAAMPQILSRLHTSLPHLLSLCRSRSHSRSLPLSFPPVLGGCGHS